MKAGPHLIDAERMRASLMVTLSAILAISVLALGLVTMIAFDRSIEPEVANRTRLIGKIIRSNVQRGLELGIPLNQLEGLERYLAESLQKFAEVDRVSIITATGLTVAEVERPTRPSLLQHLGLGDVVVVGQSAFSLPILDGNDFVGSITVAVSPQFVETRLREVFLDVMVIALVAILLAFELALVVVSTSVGKPLARVLRLLKEQKERNFLHLIRPNGLSGLSRAAMRLNDQASDLAERMAQLPACARSRIADALDARIAEGLPMRLRLPDFNDIRLALFLYSLASEIAAAFLPIYARNATRPEWLTPEMAAAIPLIAYLMAVAGLSPFGGRLAEHYGSRRLFCAAAPSTAIALLAMGFSESLVMISFWRAMIGVFYAIATIACQDYAIRAAGESGGTRPSGTFVAVIFGGVFCGSALGGVIAGRFGYEAALVAGSATALLSGMLALFTMSGRAGDPAAGISQPIDTTPTGKPSGIRLAILLAGIVAPLNASTAVFIWYLTPLMLTGLGHGPADIARVVMLYYLATALFSPAVAQIADGKVGPAILVIVGSAVGGLSLLSASTLGSFWGVTAAVSGLGLGHSLIRGPQFSIAVRLAGGSSRSLGILRLVERLGALLGLGICSTYLPVTGISLLLSLLGAVSLTGCVVFSIFQILGNRN